jgi:hypothetical protein
LKYLISVLSIVLAFTGLAFCQDDGTTSDYSDTSYQSTTSNSPGNDDSIVDTSKVYYAKYDLGDFRDTDWGMTRAQVKEIETATIDSLFEANAEATGYTQALHYRGEYAGYPADINYYFVDDSLTSASYSFETEDVVDDLPVEFDKIKATIDSDYWPADFDDGDWDTYDAYPYGVLEALLSDESFRKCQWYAERTEITLEIYGDTGWFVLEQTYKDVRQ